MKWVFVLMIVLVCVVVFVLVQDWSDSLFFCGMFLLIVWQELCEWFVGDWCVVYFFGYVFVGGMVIFMQFLFEIEIMFIWLLGEDLLFDYFEMIELMVVIFVDEGCWVIEIDYFKILELVFMLDDVVLVWVGDCDQEDLLCFVG